MLPKLVLVGLASSAVTGMAIIIIQQYLFKRKLKILKAELSVEMQEAARDIPQNSEQEELINEQLSRNIGFLGKEGVEKVRNSFVIVVGLGGVGSHCAHMLVRSGIEHIRLIDFDQVTLSSLNRHAVATRGDVGIPKVIAMRKHLLKTCPHAKIEPMVQMFDMEAAKTLLSGNPDFVIDCIDHLETKAELIGYCLKNNIRIISSMGAGAKADASRIQISDISETFEDPLARSTRITLRKNGYYGFKVPVVYSTEKPNPQLGLLPLDEDKVADADQYAALPSFRSRILPVLGTIPALFGNAAASYVLTELADFKTEPLQYQANKKLMDRFYKDFAIYEKNLQAPAECQLLLGANDLGFIFEETWKSKSALNGTVNERLVMIRWDKRKPGVFGNIICFTKKEAQRHMKLEFQDLDAHYPKEFLDYVAKRFEFEQEIKIWR